MLNRTFLVFALLLAACSTARPYLPATTEPVPVTDPVFHADPVLVLDSHGMLMSQDDWGWCEMGISGTEQSDEDKWCLVLAIKRALGAENNQVDMSARVVRFRLLTPTTWSFEELHRQFEACGWSIDRISIRTSASISSGTATIQGTGQKIPLAAPATQEKLGRYTFGVEPSPDWRSFRLRQQKVEVWK